MYMSFMLNLRKDVFLAIDKKPYAFQITEQFGSPAQVYKIIHMFKKYKLISVRVRGAKKILAYTKKGEKIKDLLTKLEEVMK